MKTSYSLHLESNSEVHVRRHGGLSDVGDACVFVLHQGQRGDVLGVHHQLDVGLCETCRIVKNALLKVEKGSAYPWSS